MAKPQLRELTPWYKGKDKIMMDCANEKMMAAWKKKGYGPKTEKKPDSLPSRKGGRK